MIEAPFARDVGTVPAAWIDSNGHMNVLHYLAASERTSDAFYDFLGIGADYRARHGCGMFAAEHHILYKAELRQGDAMTVTAVLLDCDEKRIHFLTRVHRGADHVVAAAIEHVDLHVDLATRRTAPFRGGTLERLRAVQTAHAALSPSQGISRVMGLRHVSARRTEGPTP